jgi:tRNA threonylcarbamoyl adenosine modification protein (Sua5/YciO/YrdC/YwlC family)
MFNKGTGIFGIPGPESKLLQFYDWQLHLSKIQNTHHLLAYYTNFTRFIAEMMLIKLYENNPDQRQIDKIVELLRTGGVIIYPTDTVYGIGCDITKARAVERVARIKGVKPEKAQFSFICSDLSHLSDFARQVDNYTFKLMKSYLPGPYTFILNASNHVPKSIKQKRKTVGIRVPDNNIILEIVRQLGHPILTTSLKEDDQILEYPTDPELIHEEYIDLVDAVIDGGYGGIVPSTIIDCSGDAPEIIRQGLGELEQ